MLRLLIIILFLGVEQTFPKEIIHLTSGFDLIASAHTRENDTYRFRVTRGFITIPTDLVVYIQIVPDDPVQVVVVPRTAIEITRVLDDAATLQGLSPALLRSVAKVESDLNQASISHKGAIGVMQLMPDTARTLGVNPFVADSNALGGAMYLRNLLLRYHGNSVLALAAYNAGPDAVARYKGVPPYKETVRYIQSVLNEYNKIQRHTRKHSN